MRVVRSAGHVGATGSTRTAATSGSAFRVLIALAASEDGAETIEAPPSASVPTGVATGLGDRAADRGGLGDGALEGDDQLRRRGQRGQRCRQRRRAAVGAGGCGNAEKCGSNYERDEHEDAERPPPRGGRRPLACERMLHGVLVPVSTGAVPAMRATRAVSGAVLFTRPMGLTAITATPAAEPDDRLACASRARGNYVPGSCVSP